MIHDITTRAAVLGATSIGTLAISFIPDASTVESIGKLSALALLAVISLVQLAVIVRTIRAILAQVSEGSRLALQASENHHRAALEHREASSMIALQLAALRERQCPLGEIQAKPHQHGVAP